MLEPGARVEFLAFYDGVPQTLTGTVVEDPQNGQHRVCVEVDENPIIKARRVMKNRSALTERSEAHG